jgi:hypothetical protein
MNQGKILFVLIIKLKKKKIYIKIKFFYLNYLIQIIIIALINMKCFFK